MKIVQYIIIHILKESIVLYITNTQNYKDFIFIVHSSTQKKKKKYEFNQIKHISRGFR